MPPIASPKVKPKPPSWLYQYRCLVRRNFHSYVRSYGNVLARLTVNLAVGLIAGLLYQNLGASQDAQTLQGILGE